MPSVLLLSTISRCKWWGVQQPPPNYVSAAIQAYEQPPNTYQAANQLFDTALSDPADQMFDTPPAVMATTTSE